MTEVIYMKVMLSAAQHVQLANTKPSESRKQRTWGEGVQLK